MTTIDNTEIRYDRTTRDFAILVDGQVIGYGRNYSEAEAKRTAYLAERDEELSACSGFGCVDGCGDCAEDEGDTRPIADQLADDNLRPASGGERGYYALVWIDGEVRSVWACPIETAAALLMQAA